MNARLPAGVEGEAPRDRRFVTALARGLEVLRCFGPDDLWLGHREIARRTGLPPSTVSRLAYTLKMLGCLKAGPGIGQYGLDAGVIALGFSMLGRYDIARIARPTMQALADEAGVQVALCVRHGLEVVYVGHCRAPQARSVLGLDVGARLPLAPTAAGRALVAGLEPAEQRRLLQQLQQAARPEAELQGLRQALQAHAAEGFTRSTEDWERGVSAVAVPLQLGAGLAPMALSCGTASSALGGAEMATLGQRLRAAAEEVRHAVQRGGEPRTGRSR